MKVIGKDRTSCDVCNPIDEILARLDALERRASAIVAKVQGLAPDGEGNVTLPTSSSDTDPLHGRVDAFAMSSEVKEAADDAHAYAASIADDVDVLQQNVNQLSNTVAGYGDRLSTAESKNSEQDSEIAALRTADGQNVKINRVDQYAVGLTGNQDSIAGIKTFISGILNITSGTPEVRFYDDANKTNLIAGMGVRYKTPTSTNASIRSYAPKIDPTDKNEIQRGGFLQLVSNQNGTMTLNVFATKADGSLASKVIASFDGTSWS